MLNLTPQFALLAIVTTGIGAIMGRLGVARGALRLRREYRRCVSCGTLTRGPGCERCGR